ncbi:ABC transporter permease [Sphaerotilus sp.]|uniref:ABC transporter permease n=1 Tax=Sphaerotilus sp. TaxID=2093942 RepID=UPI002ACD86B0|nr:ABC transporter permease [Sphaerotilus sp.]MDZ7855361.1 ABC transporter permease [Sphaerotilus sp.]
MPAPTLVHPMPPEAATPPRRSSWAVMRSVVFALSLRELKTRLDGRWGGAVWVIGEPLLNTLGMLAVYSAMRAQTIGGVDTLLFLVSGQLPFLLFRSLVLRLMEAIDSNLGLFAYRQVQPIDAVIARAVVEVLVFSVVMGTCLAGLGWAGHAVLPHRPLELVAALGLMGVMGFSLGLFMAVGTTGPLNRLRGLVTMCMLPVYISSGALIPLANLPAGLQAAFLHNPVAHLLDQLRSALLGPVYHAVPHTGWTLPLAWTLGTALAALSLYRARRQRLQMG